VTEHRQSLPGDDSLDAGMMTEEQVIEEMFDQDQDFAGLGVDFDFCQDLQLDGADFPMDIWNPEPSTPTDLQFSSQKLEENFSLEDDFNQMLNEWDNQLDSLQTSEVEDVLKHMKTDEDTKTDEVVPEIVEPPQQTTQTVTLKKPNPTSTYRGMITSNQTRQIPISSPIRAPLVTRGVCYTRTGGLGVSRSVHSSGHTAPAPRTSLANQYSITSRGVHNQAEEQPFLFTPVSPIRSPQMSSSNAPDFFIASTRSTADVVKSSYSRLINQCRNSIITTNPDSVNKYSESRNPPVKIIAAVSPKSDGTSSAKILSSNSIRESLPKELIDKIRAASQGRKTIAIIEPINRKEPSNSLDQASRPKQTRFNNSVAASLGKWRNVGTIPPYSNNVSDHDYCSPSRASRFSRKYLNAQHKVMKQIEESMSRNKVVGGRVTSPVEEGETKKDSGLESCEMSDASEDGTLYDKLPRYLTNASVQTTESRSVQDDHGYNRLPAYLIKPQKSLLKSNLSKSLADKHNIVLSPVESFDQKADYSDIKSEISLEEPGPTIKLETSNTSAEVYERKDMIRGSDERNLSRVSLETRSDKDKPQLKRRRSFDSSSDETDASYWRSYKRRRSNHPRDKGREPRDARRRYRGRSRSCSSSPDRRSRGGRSWDQDRSRRHGERRDRVTVGSKLEHRVHVEERKIVYVGKIEEGTLKSDLRTRFETFGPIVDISVHFRERGDNYGFLTFQNQADANSAIEHGNDDKSLPQYDLCFGGRRTFCRENYYDMDDVEVDETGGGGPEEFDELLRRARKEIRLN